MESSNSGDWAKAIGEAAYRALAELVAAVGREDMGTIVAVEPR